MFRKLVILLFTGAVVFSFSACTEEEADMSGGQTTEKQEQPGGAESAGRDEDGGTSAASGPAEAELKDLIAAFEPKFIDDSDFSALPAGGEADAGSASATVSQGTVPTGGDRVARVYDYKVDLLGWSDGGSLEEAGPGYVFFTESSVEGIGGNPELRYYLIPEDNLGNRVPVQAAFNIVELMDTGEYESEEELEAKNQEMQQLAGEILADWDPSPIETRLPDAFDVFITGNKARQTEEEFTEWRMILSLRHRPTGWAKPFAQFEMWCTGPETFTFQHGRVGPTGRSTVLRIRTPMVMEFVPEADLLYVIGPELLAQYFNEVGFEYYKTEQYEEASYFFQSALRCIPEHVLAAYNAACMEALQANGPGALYFLNRLKEIETEEALKRIEKAESDGDFDPVRGDPSFQAGWKELKAGL